MKKNCITFVLLFTISISAFASYYPTEPLSSWSVRKTATAGIYSSDSDNVTAADIFDLERSMLSIQYMPISEDVISKNTNTLPQMLQAYFGIAIKEQMYFAMAGAYDPNLSFINNKSSGVKSKNNNPTGMIRPVFRINDKVALEYLFVYNGYNVNSGSDIETKYNQKHRLAAAIWVNSIRINIPVSISLAKDYTKNTSSEININAMRLDFDPEIWFSLNKGPLQGVNIALNINADVINKNSLMTAKNPSRFGGVLSVYPSVRWTLADGIVDLGIDPEVGLEIEISKRGYASGESGNISTNMIRPYISIPFGTVIKAGQYVEVYAGFSYDLEYIFNTIDNKLASPIEKINENMLISKMSAMAGFGIHVKEDVSIDFVIKVLLAANSIGSTPNSSSKNIFDIERVGLQATYRF